MAVVLEEELLHEVEARSHKRPPEGNGRKRRQSRASKKAGQTRRLETNHLNFRGGGKESLVPVIIQKLKAGQTPVLAGAVVSVPGRGRQLHHGLTPQKGLTASVVPHCSP